MLAQLGESYRVILESANVIAMGGGTGRGEGVAESVEQMLRAAVYNHLVLDAAMQRASVEPAHDAAAVAHAKKAHMEGAREVRGREDA